MQLLETLQIFQKRQLYFNKIVKTKGPSSHVNLNFRHTVYEIVGLHSLCVFFFSLKSPTTYDFCLAHKKSILQIEAPLLDKRK